MSGLRGEARAGAPHSTLAARLAASRRRAFVGRAGELDLFRAGLSEDPSPFAVLFVHGPGGVGKTALLRRMADDAEAAGWMAAFVDCRSAGHPAAFLPALASALGVDTQAEPLAALHGGPRTVLILDTYEAASSLDPWLREVFLPNLPAGVLVVVAGRDRPDPGWRSDPSWHDLLRVVALRNLAPDDARALLRIRGLPDAVHDGVLQLTGGHPLALSLIADVVAQTGRVPQTHGQVPDVVAALLERFVCDAASPAQRQALQVCAHARFTTEPLLRAVVGEADATGLFDWLRSLSFVEASPQGLWPHDLAREVLDHDLRWRDEAAYGDLHQRIREHVVRRLRATRARAGTAHAGAAVPASAQPPPESLPLLAGHRGADGAEAARRRPSLGDRPRRGVRRPRVGSHRSLLGGAAAGRLHRVRASRRTRDQRRRRLPDDRRTDTRRAGSRPVDRLDLPVDGSPWTAAPWRAPPCEPLQRLSPRLRPAVSPSSTSCRSARRCAG